MTAKQKAAREKFKKVVAEASKLRKKNPKLTQAQAVKQAWAIQYSKEGKSKPKKVAAIKIIEKGESKKAKPKATYQQVRTKKGTYKGLKKVSGNDETEKIIKKAHESITRIKGKNYSPTSYEIQKWIDENINVKKKLGAASSKVKAKKGKSTEMHTDTKSHNVNIRVLSGLFDTSVIKDLDQLKKEYFKLAKTYHPDAGGTKEQFQALQNEYEKLLKNLINGSSLSSDQKKNEFEVDKAIRDIIDSIISLEGINIELVGKWLWISGNTYPVRNELKKAGLLYIKKDGFPYWVYKGSMSRGRGNLSIDEIKQKYGSRVIESRQVPKIGSIGQVKINKNKFASAIQKLVRSLNKRPV